MPTVVSLLGNYLLHVHKQLLFRWNSAFTSVYIHAPCH